MKQKGFTLVEMSIVVVLIGILLAGVLSTRSLIGSAHAKDVIAIVEDLRAATAMFKKRYGYLPGDLPYTAGEILGVTAAGTGGTIGDGAIGGAVDAQGLAALGSEAAEAPWQLFNAGLLGKINTSDPQRLIMTNYGSVHLVSYATAVSKVAGFAANPAARNAILFSNLPCGVVREVDLKIDDGNTATGRAIIDAACVNDADTVQWYAVVL